MAEQRSFWERPVFSTEITWGQLLLATILILAVLTRFWDLPYRAWNHDESIHTDWSWNLYTGRGYQHNPIYHGPLLYHATAFIFFLLGDNDVTARIPNVLFGLGLVAIPYLFRKWLGTKGALITSAMLLISPAVLYYSRFNRHDVYVEFFVMLMALAIMKYFDERREFWLFASALLLAFSFTAMETTFIFAAVFAIFLCGHFTFELLRPQLKGSYLPTLLISSLLGIPFFGTFIAYHAVRTWMNKESEEDQAQWRAIPSFDLAMVFAIFCMPLLTPALIHALNPLWTRLFKAEFFPSAAFTDVNTITSIAQSQPDVMIRMIVLTVLVILVASILGVWWNARRWIICALLFWPVFMFFFTTVFTNGGGLFTGLGSLGYWLSQQTVERGGQPSYYYLLVMLPEYEILPYLVGLATIFLYWWRRRTAHFWVVLGWMAWIVIYYTTLRPILLGIFANSNLGTGVFEQLVVAFFAVLIPLAFFASYDPDSPSSAFPSLIFTWVAGVIVIFSWAGEKMPWLTMHLTIPLAFAAGWGLDKLCDRDSRSLLSRGAIWLALSMGLAVVLLVMLATARPFQGVSLDALSATNSFLISLLLLVIVVAPALYMVGRRFDRVEMVRIAGGAVVLILTLLTIHFAWMVVYINPDSAVETMIYAQGSHDDVTVMREIEDLSRRLCGQRVTSLKPPIPCEDGRIKVAYDQESAWPFVWYLRNYRNAQFYGKQLSAPTDAPVVIVSQANDAAVKPLLGGKYWDRVYKLIWWPLEGYKDLTFKSAPTLVFRDRRYAMTPHGIRIGRSPENDLIIDDAGVAEHQALVWQEDGIVYIHNEGNAWNTILNGQLLSGPTVIRSGNQIQIGRNVLSVQDANPGIWDIATSPSLRSDLFNAWFYHRYKENQSEWPLVNIFHFYVRKDIAAMLWNYASLVPNQTGAEDEYAKKLIQKTAARTCGTEGNGPGQFQAPRNIALDPQGNLYVLDSDNHRVQKFDASGRYLLSWGGKSPEGILPPPSTFDQPWGIAVDKSGNVFVADTWNHRIQKFDSQGKFLLQWGTNGDTHGVAQGDPFLFYGPRAIAIDPQGTLWVTDTGNKRVLKFSPQGEALGQFGGLGSDKGQFQEPVGLAIDAQGNIYVADTWNQRVQKFDSAFNYLAEWPVQAWSSQSVVNKPYLAVSSEGQIVVSDPENARVIQFSSNGKLQAVWGTPGTDLNSFNLPTGLAFDESGNLYVADSGNERVLVFSKP